MKDKTVAALLAFFFGWLGIHKFYLGENLAGILYFVFSWTFIPGLIAFFEFFGLLLMSDTAFNAKYNPAMLSGNSGGGTRSAKDVTGALGELHKLYEAGALTPEEYEEKRKKLLKDL